MKLFVPMLLSAIAFSCSDPETTGDDAGDDSPDGGATWSPNLVVERVAVASTSLFSSTRLEATWDAGLTSIDHYELVATSADGFHVREYATEEVSIELDELFADTSYEVAITGCLDADCTIALSTTDSANGETPTEVWQLEGTGNSYATMTQVVENGGALSFALRLGSYSEAHEGETLYLFNPVGTAEFLGGVRFATAPEFSETPTFTTLDAGLEHSCNAFAMCPAGAPYMILAAQAVPLTSPAATRLFFEATEIQSSGMSSSWPVRIYQIDSTDGYDGRDYREGTGATCEGADYATGGACELTLAIGLEGETLGGRTWDSGLEVARQFKIGYAEPQFARWDQSAGSAFMIITAGDSCGQTDNGLFMATWDGSDWIVVKDDDDCARPLALLGHGPLIVHLGEGRYKIYYEDATDGMSEKPLRVLYADAARTGDPESVEFEDVDASSAGREVDFLWPDDSPVDAGRESGLGDHAIYLPNGGLDFQVMYMNLGGLDAGDTPAPSIGLGMSVLMNP